MTAKQPKKNSIALSENSTLAEVKEYSRKQEVLAVKKQWSQLDRIQDKLEEKNEKLDKLEDKKDKLMDNIDYGVDWARDEISVIKILTDDIANLRLDISRLEEQLMKAFEHSGVSKKKGGGVSVINMPSVGGSGAFNLDPETTHNKYKPRETLEAVDVEFSEPDEYDDTDNLDF